MSDGLIEIFYNYKRIYETSWQIFARLGLKPIGIKICWENFEIYI